MNEPISVKVRHGGPAVQLDGVLLSDGTASVNPGFDGTNMRAAEEEEQAPQQQVWRNETIAGTISGTAFGPLRELAAWTWKRNADFGPVIGAALAINTVVAVSIDASVPLLLRRFKFDPAAASGPLKMTMTDMYGFFQMLCLTSLLLPAIS